MKKVLAMLLCVVLVFGLVACGGSQPTPPAAPPAAPPAGGGDAPAADPTEETFNLRVGHNLAEDHTVHLAMLELAEMLETQSGGTITLQIFPNSVLGSPTDMLVQVQNGALDMVKISAASLANFNNVYNAYSVPYLFESREHFFTAMDSDLTQEIFASTAADGFIGLTWLDSGSRSFYTRETPVRHPDDLQGLIIRTMDSPMAIRMMELLGGASMVMGFGDIYTALQQGVIDGAENNVTALRDHGEVAPYYSFTHHTRIPDIVVIGEAIFSQMSENQQAIVRAAAHQMSINYRAAWQAFEEEVLERVVNEFGVILIEDVDFAAFQAAVQPMWDELREAYPEVYEVVQAFSAMAR